MGIMNEDAAHFNAEEAELATKPFRRTVEPTDPLSTRMARVRRATSRLPKLPVLDMETWRREERGER